MTYLRICLKSDMSRPTGYRDSLYIIKDVILALARYGELNQTSLISFCGLNLKKHRHFLDELEEKQMIIKYEQKQGKRNVMMYKSTPKGMEFCSSILEPYEDIFPRKLKPTSHENSKLSLLILV